MTNLPTTRLFDKFRFDADRFALYFENELVKDADKKTMQVLAVLLLNPKKLTTHDEIIEQVWQDNPHGVTSGHIGQYISKLRKIFAKFAPEKTYIETVKGRGYSFVGDVLSDEIVPLNVTDAPSEDSTVLPNAEDITDKKIVSPFFLPKYVFVPSALILLSLLIFLGWAKFPENDEEKIRQVVKESQIFESLVLYKNPAAFKEESLDKYWTTEFEIGTNYDRQRIREAVKKLNDENLRYGDETKCEQFEFQSVEINQNKNTAIVKTLEKWFISVYFNDGTLQKNKYVGPYFVSYIVKKIDGKWLIEKSNTARTIRPTPRLSGIEAISEIQSGEQFLVKITGQDFESETVHIEILGAGCPETKPCRVTNYALRENSKLTETVLDNVSLKLASGDFQVIVRNGDSKASNALSLKVP